MARTKDYMHIHSETRYKTDRNIQSAPRAAHIKVKAGALLSRNDYRRIVAEMLG